MSKANNKILVISPIATHPQNAGNKRRIYNMLKYLQSLGLEVHFVYCDYEHARTSEKKNNIEKMHEEWDEIFRIDISEIMYFSDIFSWIVRRVKQVGMYLFHNYPIFYNKISPNFNKYFTQIKYYHTEKYNKGVDSKYDRRIDKEIQKIIKKHNYRVVLCQYVFMSKVLENFQGNILKVIDTHDVFTERHKIFKNLTIDYGWITLGRKEEARGLSRADVVLGIQDSDCSFFREIISNNKKVVSVGHISMGLEEKNSAEISYYGKTILFVGTDIIPNILAVEKFLKESFPHILEKFPDTRFMLAGRVAEHFYHYQNVVNLSEVKDVQELYKYADVVISPVDVGTGLKIKNVEALENSKALITTPHGAIGLEKGINKAFLVAENSNEFAVKVIEVLSDEKMRISLQLKAKNFFEEYNRANKLRLKNVFG